MMDIVYILAPIALAMGVGFTYLFIRAVKSGQYDDLETPAYRMLLDDSEERERGKKDEHK